MNKLDQVISKQNKILVEHIVLNDKKNNSNESFPNLGNNNNETVNIGTECPFQDTPDQSNNSTSSNNVRRQIYLWTIQIIRGT